MKDLAKIRFEWTARAARVAFIAWTLAQSAAAQQFQPVPPPAAGRSALPATPMSGQQLLSALRKGGYVIYFRHTSTDFSRDDSRSKSDEDCDNQRPLTDKGREEARQIGAAFRELKIPVSQVLASPRCRTMETAMLAFGRADKADEARGGPSMPDSPDRYAPLRTLLSTPGKAGRKRRHRQPRQPVLRHRRRALPRRRRSSGDQTVGEGLRDRRAGAPRRLAHVG